MMSRLAGEIWGELKRYINTQDHADAADTMISVLIDNDVDADDIRDAFKGDASIKQALTSYLDDHEEVVDDEDLDEEDEDD